MRYSGIQPHYFPRLHYFARITSADTFVIRDDAQFVRKHKYPDGRTGKSYQAHTPIKFTSGTHLLMVPIKHDGKKSIDRTEVQYRDDWVGEHLKTLEIFYRKSPNFKTIFPEIQAIITQKFKTLGQLNSATILWGLLRLMGFKKVAAHQLSLDFVLDNLEKQNIFRLKSIKKGSESKALKRLKNADPNDKIIALLKEVGATEDYCGGTGAAAYMDRDLFEKHGIKITVQDWKCREYHQLFTKQHDFIPNMSIIDLFMNVSQDEAVSIIKG